MVLHALCIRLKKRLRVLTNQGRSTSKEAFYLRQALRIAGNHRTRLGCRELEKIWLFAYFGLVARNEAKDHGDVDHDRGNDWE